MLLLHLHIYVLPNYPMYLGNIFLKFIGSICKANSIPTHSISFHHTVITLHYMCLHYISNNFISFRVPTPFHFITLRYITCLHFITLRYMNSLHFIPFHSISYRILHSITLRYIHSFVYGQQQMPGILLP